MGGRSSAGRWIRPRDDLQSARPELVEAASGYMHRLADLLDRMVGIAARYLEELLIGRLLRRYAEALSGRIPLGGGLLQGRLRILPAPYRRAHPVDRERVILRAGHDDVNHAAISA